MMTNEQINRLCAEAMGWHTGRLASKVVAYDVRDCAIIAGNDSGGESVYDPLHNDAQAMALVKRFDLNFEKFPGSAWEVSRWSGSEWSEELFSDDLNRAICECVAKMQKAQSSPA